MHIVDVAEFYAPLGGGVKTYIDAKLNFAHQNGAKVTVIAPGPENRVEPREGGQVIYVKAPAIPVDTRYHVFWKAQPVHQLLDELKPDVVEASSPFRGAWIVANWQGHAARRTHKALFMHADPVAAHFQVWTQDWLKADTVDKAAFWYWRYLARTARRYQSVVVGSRWFGQRIQKTCQDWPRIRRSDREVILQHQPIVSASLQKLPRSLQMAQEAADLASGHLAAKTAHCSGGVVKRQILRALAAAVKGGKAAKGDACALQRRRRAGQAGIAAVKVDQLNVQPVHPPVLSGWGLSGWGLSRNSIAARSSISSASIAATLRMTRRRWSASGVVRLGPRAILARNSASDRV